MTVVKSPSKWLFQYYKIKTTDARLYQTRRAVPSSSQCLITINSRIHSRIHPYSQTAQFLATNSIAPEKNIVNRLRTSLSSMAIIAFAYAVNTSHGSPLSDNLECGKKCSEQYRQTRACMSRRAYRTKVKFVCMDWKPPGFTSVSTDAPSSTSVLKVPLSCSVILELLTRCDNSAL